MAESKKIQRKQERFKECVSKLLVEPPIGEISIPDLERNISWILKNNNWQYTRLLKPDLFFGDVPERIKSRYAEPILRNLVESVEKHDMHDFYGLSGEDYDEEAEFTLDVYRGVKDWLTTRTSKRLLASISRQGLEYRLGEFDQKKKGKISRIPVEGFMELVFITNSGDPWEFEGVYRAAVETYIDLRDHINPSNFESSEFHKRTVDYDWFESDTYKLAQGTVSSGCPMPVKKQDMEKIKCPRCRELVGSRIRLLEQGRKLIRQEVRKKAYQGNKK